MLKVGHNVLKTVSEDAVGSIGFAYLHGGCRFLSDYKSDMGEMAFQLALISHF